MPSTGKDDDDDSYRKFVFFPAEWLLRIASHYYDVSTFPPCEAKEKLKSPLKTWIHVTQT
jgi:hypothetical protein